MRTEQTAARVPLIGETLAGKYLLKSLLGEGGMGVVFAAEHVRLRQSMAIKFLNPEMLGVAEIVERFEREARAAATLKGRHVVRVTDVEQTPEGVPYMVMELLDGTDLESERERRGKLPFVEVVDYVLQACAALAEAHDAGIVHRDLKPANLFLAREREEDRPIVKILDFGISKFMNAEDEKLTSAGAVMGTALYMSPEQIRGDTAIDARTDIWSLGVILYELIAGVPPWSGAATRVAAAIVAEPPPDLHAQAQVPEPLVQAILTMLAKDPAHRPRSIAEVASALAPFALTGSVGAQVAETLARRSQRGLAAGAAPPSTPRILASNLPPAGSLPPSSERAASARSVVERQTTGGTSTNIVLGRPRVFGMLAVFGALAVLGIVLISMVGRAKPDTAKAPAATSSTTMPAATAAKTAGAVAEPSGVATPEPPPPPTSAAEPSSTTAAKPSPATTSAAVAAPVAKHVAPAAPSASVPKLVAPSPAPAPRPSPSATVNPTLL